MAASKQREFSIVTEDSLASLRGMIGKEVRRGRPYVEELTADAIRHYARGIGDSNPLWIDPEHAASSVHDCPLAPPTMLYAVDKIVSGYVMGLPGVHAMFAGTEFRYERALALGDRLRGVAILKELTERRGRFAGRSWQQTYEVSFFDHHGELVATANSYTFRTERDAARERGKYESKPIYWTPRQLEEIAARYRAQEERRRGATPRYIEDVSPGDAVPEILKGPYTATTAITYLLGWGGLYVRAHGDAFDLYARHPQLGIINEWGVPEPPERVHWDADLARRVGVPSAYDYGPERVSWMGQVVTDWMGDHGFLRRFRVELRRHNLMGELVTCRGTVTSVNRTGGVATLSLEAHNQDGEESARGSAEVVLPSRA